MTQKLFMIFLILVMLAIVVYFYNNPGSLGQLLKQLFSWQSAPVKIIKDEFFKESEESVKEIEDISFIKVSDNISSYFGQVKIRINPDFEFQVYLESNLYSTTGIKINNWVIKGNLGEYKIPAEPNIYLRQNDSLYFGVGLIWDEDLDKLLLLDNKRWIVDDLIY